MDEDTPAKRLGSWIAVGAAGIFAFAGAGYAAKTAWQYGYLTGGQPPAPAEPSLPAPQAAVTPPATVTPQNPSPNVVNHEVIRLAGSGKHQTLRTIPAGPGMQIVVDLYKDPAGKESISRNLVPTGRPLTLDQLPKLDLDQIRKRLALKQNFIGDTPQRALETYDKLNGPDSPGYEPGREAVELFSYYATADDGRGECWFQTAAFYAKYARDLGNHDILVEAITAAFHLEINDTIDGYTQRESLNEILGLQSSAYPAAVKLPPLLSALKDLSFIGENYADPGMKPDDDRRYIPYMLDAGVTRIEELARERARSTTLHFYAGALLDKTVPDSGRREMSLGDGSVAMSGKVPYEEAKRSKYEALIAGALARGNAPGEVEALLKAEYLSDSAQDAVGLADDPIPDGHALAEIRLNEAVRQLDDAWAKYPKFILIPIMKMRMQADEEKREEWYQKALAMNPHYLPTYLNKMDLLQPMRFGSPQEVFDYGMECLHSGEWDIGLPLVFTKGMETLSGQMPSLYSNEKVRDMVDSTYREYLRRYPNSLQTRTRYLLFAVAAKDWPTAKYQLTTLGNFWDMTQISPWRYSEIVDEVAEHSGS